VDHASGSIITQHQPTLGSGKMEQFFSDHNVPVHNFHTDNGIFTCMEFCKHCLDHDKISLSGVGAHHQNSVTECALQTVMMKAHTMMIHLQLLWPDHFTANLWLFASSYATWLHNHTPTEDLGFSLIELFSGVRLSCHHLQRVRVLRCPAYVLMSILPSATIVPLDQM
jgi:hypothetical protein